MTPGCPPAANPVAIRGCLTPDLAAVFDVEWEFVLATAARAQATRQAPTGSVSGEEIRARIDILPLHLLLDYARALDAVTVAPWDGAPHNANNPDSELVSPLYDRIVCRAGPVRAEGTVLFAVSASRCRMAILLRAASRSVSNIAKDNGGLYRSYLLKE